MYHLRFSPRANKEFLKLPFIEAKLTDEFISLLCLHLLIADG
jgi:mRNA-degrading endonuclease RelE of RelBE toxin-antitoxin system